jgi:hypothetical protein
MRVESLRRSPGGPLLMSVTGTYEQLNKKVNEIVNNPLYFFEILRVEVPELASERYEYSEAIASGPNERVEHIPAVEYIMRLSDASGTPVALEPTNPSVSNLFPYIYGPPVLLNRRPSEVRPGTNGALFLRATANLALRRYLGATEGDPSYAPGLWLRMAYLSATTVTTLGLGDITPVSSVARLLVGLEALIGITAAGLFLNAVARRWRQPQLGS